MKVVVSIFAALSLLLSGCYYPGHTERHYTTNFNFVVTGDSIALQDQKPMHLGQTALVMDTDYVTRGDQLVVAQIAVIPEDSIDSVWVKVARDQETMGWVHESELLPKVAPDDPISSFINLFSQRHLWYFAGLIGIALVAFLVRHGRRQRFRMVHADDIATCYPTLLCLMLSCSALIYASIQRHVPETWVHFYYHPTLNPFGLPLLLGAFVLSIWLMLLLLIASLDEIRRQLAPLDAMLYILSLLAVLMVEYLFFSLAALAYVGYPVFFIYAVLAIRRYWRHYRPHYLCSQCGCKMHAQGKCPRCGTYNS
ncbi:MAG: zinc ribbon domain-containing protein [Bacteroidaceae bacterium]|nr:zinc ribbon domain-containing protein [Bacteroidaceae bacterium]